MKPEVRAVNGAFTFEGPQAFAIGQDFSLWVHEQMGSKTGAFKHMRYDYNFTPEVGEKTDVVDKEVRSKKAN